MRTLRSRTAYTLLELLVVVGLIAAFASLLLGGLGGTGRAAALQSGQAVLVDLVTAARTRALATGHRTRLLVRADPDAGEVFRRELALQEEGADGSWVLQETVRLPEGIHVLPYRNRIPPGLYADETAWVEYNGSGRLESSALSSAPLGLTGSDGEAQEWDYIQFAAAGTTGTSGTFVLGTGRLLAPGTTAPGEAPVRLENPDGVRGLVLSAYGLPRLINDRRGFQ